MGELWDLAPVILFGLIPLATLAWIAIGLHYVPMDRAAAGKEPYYPRHRPRTRALPWRPIEPPDDRHTGRHRDRRDLIAALTAGPLELSESTFTMSRDRPRDL